MLLELYNLFLNHKPSLVVPTKRDKDINTIGYLLKQTKDLRVHADYRVNHFLQTMHMMLSIIQMRYYD